MAEITLTTGHFAGGQNLHEDRTVNPEGLEAHLVALRLASPTDLSSTGAGAGDSLVGIEDASGYFTGATVEAALKETATKLASTAATLGASLIGIEDASGFFTGTEVEAALKETQTKLAATSAGLGAALVGIQDASGIITGASVEAALKEIQLLVQGTGVGLLYTPTTAGNWTGTAPTQVLNALDRLAAAVYNGITSI